MNICIETITDINTNNYKIRRRRRRIYKLLIEEDWLNIILSNYANNNTNFIIDLYTYSVILNHK
jgi:hypothetical protein